VSETTRPTDAHLTLYSVSRHYGGPEEGGWYYDRRELAGPSLPFRALQPTRTHWFWREGADGEGERDFEIEDCGPPVPATDEERALVAAFRAHVESVYEMGQDRPSRSRFSCATPHGEDLEWVYELTHGAHVTTERPRYE
jgi:hypothetical protein